MPKAAPRGALKLFGEAVLPVCSPRLLTRATPLARAEDLRYHVLLHYELPGGVTPWLSWTVWLETMQLPGLKPAGSLRFVQYDQIIRAAADGQGVALGTTPLVKELIKQGKLVAPLAGKVDSSRAYYLVISAAAAERPEVKDFAGWLLRQARPGRTNRGKSQR